MNAVELNSATLVRPTGNSVPARQNQLAEESKAQVSTATQISQAQTLNRVEAEKNAVNEPVITAEQLGTAVESINQFVNAQMRTLNFSVDETSGKAVVKVIDFETKDVIRQIPGEEVLKMASAIKRLQDDLGSATGLLINNQV
jgi:flagellar protein FlaG